MFEFGFLALLLGVKHSFDADHLVAVSNLLCGAKSLGNALKLGLSWAIGHMLTASIITALLYAYRDSILPLILDRFELVVGFMLVFLGLISLYQARILHSHPHRHNGRPHRHFHIHLPFLKGLHSHRHMLGIGIIHGLASNDELLVLLTASLGLASLGEMIAGVAIFSMGVVIGMLIFSALFILPILKMESEKLRGMVTAGVGGISIVYGAMMLTGM